MLKYSNEVAGNENVVFDTVVTNEAFLSMDEADRIEALKGILGQDELNLAELLERCATSKHLNSAEEHLATEIIKSHPRVRVLLKLINNRQCVCEVKNPDGKHLAYRFLTHHKSKYVIFDDTTGFAILFSELHYNFRFEGNDIILTNKKTSAVTHIKGDELIQSGQTTEPFTTTGSREVDSVSFSTEERYKPVHIKYANIVYGVARGYEILNTLSIFGIKLYDLHHTKNYVDARFDYRVNGGWHPDCLGNLQILTKEEHKKITKAERAAKKATEVLKVQEEFEFERQKEIDRQKEINLEKLLG